MIFNKKKKNCNVNMFTKKKKKWNFSKSDGITRGTCTVKVMVDGKVLNMTKINTWTV